MSDTSFAKLAAVDVSGMTEKKGNLTYLSWASAVDQLLRHDPNANWEILPRESFPDGTMMVWCKVTAFGNTRIIWLPVIDHKNRPITNPDAFQVNTAQMRCLAKGIAVATGIGLYIYRGEDLPPDESGERQVGLPDKEIAAFKTAMLECTTLEALHAAYTKAIMAARNVGDKELELAFRALKDDLKANFKEAA